MNTISSNTLRVLASKGPQRKLSWFLLERNCTFTCFERYPNIVDLSAAFKTLDHDILISRLRCHFGFYDTVLSCVLKWFSTYLSGRTQSVIIGDTTSSPRSVDFGVPQGSILGPLLFSLYVAPLQDIVAAHRLDSKFYADDALLYIAINPNDYSPALDTLRNCIDDVMNWNTLNMLLCNPAKTEVRHNILFLLVFHVPILQSNCLTKYAIWVSF